MAQVHGSVGGAERFRQKALNESKKIYEDTQQIQKKLKKAARQCDKAEQGQLEELNLVFTKAVRGVNEVLQQLGVVTKEMERYRNFIRFLNRTARLGAAATRTVQRAHIQQARRAGGTAAARQESEIPAELIGKVRPVQRLLLDAADAATFAGARYSTVVAVRDLVLYRCYGAGAGKQGRFLSTVRPSDRLFSKMGLALPLQWKNNCTLYCTVFIPAGTVFQVGQVAAQATASGSEAGVQDLPGGMTQVLLSQQQVTENPSWYGPEHPLKYPDAAARMPREALEKAAKHTPKSGAKGRWMQERGNSVWIPADPGVQAALQRYGAHGVEYVENFPDFEPFAAFETSLNGDELQLSDRVQGEACAACLADFWESVAQDCGVGEMDDPLENARYCELLGKTFGCDDPEKLEDIQLSLSNAEKPYGFTWHHDVLSGKMLLVPTLIHDSARHLGGRSIWGGGRSRR